MTEYSGIFPSRAIGKHLARLEDINVVTGGFFGVGETIGRAYDEERKILDEECLLWHVLPERDDQVGVLFFQFQVCYC